MKFIADLHIHSHYSLATSKQLTPEYLDYWAKRKGITVVGTGDFTHPGWLNELQEKLEPAEEGLYRLKPEYELEGSKRLKGEVRFLLTSEISNIYKKNGKVRKVHSVIFTPNFSTAGKFQAKLRQMNFNITSDGRPIIGMDAKKLLDLTLDVSRHNFFIPAHIWTPWFSILGAKSGFDSVQECFEDLSEHIYAVETGLSTDPPMNWICSFLDKYNLVSNSDAHSPEKLGRNANIFNTELSYFQIIEALKDLSGKKFTGTIDMFPQEGKYHYDGHRKCGVCWNPVETLEHAGICSHCGKKVTIGVTNRVTQLSDRENILERKNRNLFHSLIPLKEILAEIRGTNPGTKTIDKEYHRVLEKTGTEFDVLLHLSKEELLKAGGTLLAEAIIRMRNKEVYITEGFDGEYGRIKVFADGEIGRWGSSQGMFTGVADEIPKPPTRALLNFDLKRYRELSLQPMATETLDVAEEKEGYGTDKTELLQHLNKEQAAAVQHTNGPAMILAGPGTGKTQTLTTRIAYLIKAHGVKPNQILAVTFTHKAAGEMQHRLGSLLGTDNETAKVLVTTFHTLGYRMLNGADHKGNTFSRYILEENDKLLVIKEITGEEKGIRSVMEKISWEKQWLRSPDQCSDSAIKEAYSSYEKYLRENLLMDLDDLIFHTVKLMENDTSLREHYRDRFRYILVDEYQDINYAQYCLIRLLAPDDKSHICVIGDPNQAIYGFRGADVRFIKDFSRDYASARIFTLHKSYRCSNRILKASGGVIHSGEEEGISLQGLQQGVKIKIVSEATEKSEAEFIARTIESMMGGVGFFSLDSHVAEGEVAEDIQSFSDFAVLCRISKQIPAIEKALQDHNIPYQVVGGESLWKKEPVSTLMDLLKYMVHPQNDWIKKRMLKKQILSEERFLHLKWEKNKITEDIVKEGMKALSQGNSLFPENIVMQVLSVARSYPDLESFLQYIALRQPTDGYQPESEKVTLMTLHASKGLEFNCVFIAGCENGLIPYSLFENQKADREEEKRLMYVGMTRARKYLHLSYAQQRFLMGQTYTSTRSPFLDKIEKDLVELQKQTARKKRAEDNQLKLF